MADQEPAVATARDEKGVKRIRGAFPRLPLSKVLELPEAVYRLGEGEPVRRVVVFDHLHKSAESSTSRALTIASSAGYGLTVGGKEAVNLGLSDKGKRVAMANGAHAKRQAIYDVLFSNEIFSSVIERFTDRGIPLDDVAIEFLKNSHNLPQPDAQVAWSVFKENITDFDLYQELSGKKVIISPDHALEILKQRSGTESPDEKNNAITETQTRTEASGKPGAIAQHSTTAGIVPQFHFNIQIVLPDSATPETYDNIFRSISTHLLGRDLSS